ncbi:MAG: 2Fe-2S iron-sulfur cluster-binding protein [Saprospiraceae bacterium]|nr:2Fe-2S iron-sulfur cluster-binding protein [Saprospiraceae bacterium]
MSKEESITIHIKDRQGHEKSYEVPLGIDLNVMEVCKSYELPVEGTCGGMALCASCHVYIHSDHDLPEPSEDEEDMLDQAFFVHDNSRLSCQIPITEGMDGLRLELAPVSE